MKDKGSDNMSEIKDQYSMLEQSVKDYFQEHPQESFLVKELSQIFQADDSTSFKSLVKILAALEEANFLVLNKYGRFGLKNNKGKLQGIFRANERGFGFVTVDPSQPDIFIPKGSTATAMEGDLVVIKITKKANSYSDRGEEAQVVEIIERKTTQIVGIFTRYSSKDINERADYGTVALTDNKLAQYECVIEAGGLFPVDGTVVIVEITSYPDLGGKPVMKGVITKEIGYKDEVGMDILTILYQLGIPTEFPEAVLEEAKRTPDTISAQDLEGRQDFRKDLTITIDGADAKDLDDAISLTKRPDETYLLGVHIADVSHYVQENSAMDQEAFERGTSVYVTDRVVPMLPQRLSNGICSLHPNEDRLTMTCQMEIDQSGTVYSYHLFPSVIESDYRMTYTDVNAIYDGDKALRDKYHEIVPMLEDMKDLHHILERRRKERGAIDFDTHEAKIIVDDKGHPIDIQVRERGVSERLIESFMLSANETVAKHHDNLHVPFIYRIHEQPNEDKMQRFLEFITAFGISIKGSSDSISPKKLQKALEQIKGEAYEAVVSTMMLRSMKQAKYDIEPSGHFGLASRDYTHFTSPIRRYPDLIVHRMMRYYFKHGKNLSQEQINGLEARLQEIADQSSKMERKAVTAERETDALKKAEFMQDKIGQSFEAVISSVTKFGIFVELPNTVEGLIHISHMNSDYYNFVESHLLLIGERTGRTFRIGDKVKVKLVKVDIDSRQIDFILEEDSQLETARQQVFNDKKMNQNSNSSKTARAKSGKKQSGQISKEKNKGKKNGPSSKNGKKNKKAKRSFTIRQK